MTDQPLIPLFPRQPVPALEIPVTSGGTWKLGTVTPERFTLLAFYRGLHCPLCAMSLKDLHAKLPALAERGVEVVALSSDTQERAERARDGWSLPDLTLGYALPLDTARAWGLYLSRGRGTTSAGVEEPELFSEPALYLVQTDGTLYFGAVQTMPFARPHYDDVLKAIDFVVAKDYPARGEVVPGTAAAVRTS